MSTYDSLGSTSELSILWWARENLKSPIFACLYSYTVWIEVVGTMFTHDPDPDWDTTLELLTTQVYNRLTFVVMCMVFQVTIYYIWIEHNKRIHNESFKPPAKLWQRFTRRFTVEFFLQDIMSDQSFEGFSNAGFPRGKPLWADVGFLSYVISSPILVLYIYSFWLINEFKISSKIYMTLSPSLISLHDISWINFW